MPWLELNSFHQNKRRDNSTIAISYARLLWAPANIHGVILISNVCVLISQNHVVVVTALYRKTEIAFCQLGDLLYDKIIMQNGFTITCTSCSNCSNN